jgi:hypothetical protein
MCVRVACRAGRFISVVMTAIVCAGLMTAVSAQQVNNPTMSAPYMATATDTIPSGWGNSAVNGACTTSWDHRTFYLSTNAADTASLKVRSSSACSQSLLQGLNRITAITGHEVLIGCYIKTQSTAGRASIAAIRYCGGGGYCQLTWNEFGRVTGNSDWTWAEGSVMIPTSAECASTCPGRPDAGVTILLFMNGLIGTAWWDSLLVMDLSTGTLLNAPATTTPLRMGHRQANFSAPANYALSVVSTNGTVIRTEKGIARNVRFFSATPAAGTYIVRLVSDHGNATRTVAISGR